MTIGGAIAELQNLINADDVPFYYKGGIEKVIETISMELPTIDIVACKDCKYYTPLDESRPFYCSIGIWKINADDFCSYGERKDNE